MRVPTLNSLVKWSYVGSERTFRVTQIMGDKARIRLHHGDAIKRFQYFIVALSELAVL